MRDFKVINPKVNPLPQFKEIRWYIDAPNLLTPFPTYTFYQIIRSPSII